MRTKLADNRLAPLAIVATAAVLAYSNTFRSPFLFDDAINIQTNPVIRSLGNFVRPSRLMELTSHSATLKYAMATRIVAYFTFALNYAIGGTGVIGYHAFNLAIHIANGWLVYVLVSTLLLTPAFARAADGQVPIGSGWTGRLAALFASLLFVCHPMQTQAVTYVSQRFASLATFFYLSSVVCFARSRLGGKAARGLFVTSVVSAALAAATKEMAVTLPLTLFVLETAFFQGGILERLRRAAPFVATSCITPLLLLYAKTYSSGHTMAASMATLAGEDVPRAYDYLVTQFTVIPKYIGLLVLPRGQNFDYQHPLYRTLLHPRVAVCAAALGVALLSAIGLLLWARRRSGSRYSAESRAISFGVIWFFITLSVESSVIPLADTMNEYRVYLPSVGFFLALVFGVLLVFEKLRTPIAARVLVFTVAAVALGFATFARNSVYANEVKFWEDVVRKSPLKPRPRTQLSVAYGRAGRAEESILEYQAAALLNPEFAKAHGRLGVAQKEFEDLMRRTAAGFAVRHNANGMNELAKGDFERAASEFQVATRLAPDYVDARSNLGFAEAKAGRFGDAIREAREAIRLQPDRGDLHYNLGLILFWSGYEQKALEEFRAAVQLNQRDVDAQKMINKIAGAR